MIRFTAIAICLILALSACGHAPERHVRVETVEVKVPVKVPCIERRPAQPVYQYGVGAWPGTETALGQLIADLEAAKSYGRQWEAATIGCEKAESPAGAASP